MAEALDLATLDQNRVLKYLLTEDYPEWAALQAHPGFSEKWVVFFLKRSRPVPRQSVEEIYGHRLFRKNYQVNLHLMRCKTAPPHVALNLVHTLRWVDLFWSLRIPHLPGAVRQKIEAQIVELLPRLTLGEQVTLARQAPRALVRHLRLMKESRVVKALLRNYFFTYEDAVFMANFPKSAAAALEALAGDPKWMRYKELKLALLRHKHTPKSLLLPLAKTVTDHDLRLLLRHPALPLFSRHLIHRILEERFCVMTGQKPAPEHEIVLQADTAVPPGATDGPPDTDEAPNPTQE